MPGGGGELFTPHPSPLTLLPIYPLPFTLYPCPHRHAAARRSRFSSAAFREVGIHPDTRHGQNFLIDLNLLRLLVDAAQLDADDVVLEVGTGTGSLTALMAPYVAEVVTVEVDAQLHQLASEELIDFENVTLLQRTRCTTRTRCSRRCSMSSAKSWPPGPVEDSSSSPTCPTTSRRPS